MAFNYKPYDFPKTRQSIIKLIGALEEKKEIVLISDVSDAIGKKKMLVSADGEIQYSDNWGEKIGGVFVLGDYGITKFGGDLPKKHIFYCDTVEDFKNKGKFHRFVYTNEKEIKIDDWEHGVKQFKVDDLPFCGNCISLLKSKFDFNSLNIDTHSEKDMHGYYREFQKISREFRKSKDYTCDNCCIQITKKQDRKWMHTHHKDMNKSNNDVSNFECLCIYCHATKDDWHRKRFLADDRNRNNLQAFMDEYMPGKIAPKFPDLDIPF